MNKACPQLKLWQVILFYLIGLSLIGYGIIYKDFMVAVFGGIVTILTSVAILRK